jgi:hypothetical protein
VSDDRNDALTEADPEVAADEEAFEEPETTEYIEFVGTPPYGVEFTSEHTVTRKQLRDAWSVSIPKDLVWRKTEGGPNQGRMLVPVSDMTPEAAAGFENDPLFKRVEL